MLGYFIGFLICGGLLALAIKLVNLIDSRINETSGWKTDALFISFLIFLVIDGRFLFYFIYEIVLIFLK